MCGICGVVDKMNYPVDELVLRNMTNVMMHRGPDDEQYFVDGSIGIGFRRLSIVDLAHGQQPIANEDESIWVVCNGEIYNAKELTRYLVHAGHQLKTKSDTEVIVHLFEEKGIACLNQLRGMFAIAIYDTRDKTLYIARDFFGIKPLFYTDNTKHFMFSSEIKSLLASKRIAPQLNFQSLWDYLSFQYVPDPNTMLEGIYKVPPGHYLRVREDSTLLQQYWKPEFKPDQTKPLPYFMDGIVDKLQHSVQRHLNGDVPYGSFLSSGIDSSAIAALMSEHKPIDTFSIGLEGADTRTDELSFARKTARLIGANHHEVRVSAEDYKEHLAKIIYYQEDPVADPSAIALYFVSQLASSYITVVLSGEGADEIFGGYPIYHEPQSLRMFGGLPLSIRRSIGRMAACLPNGIKGKSFLARGSVPLERRFIGNAKIWTDDVKHSMFIPSAKRKFESSFRITDPIYQETHRLDDITRMQAVDMQTWLPGDILMKADKMTMAHSVELRVPFLDVDLFEFAATIPTKFRIAKGQTKYALRRALDRVLPPEICNRPKLGFPIPIRQWLRGPMLDYAWDVLHASASRTLFSESQVNQLLYEHCQGQLNHARELWTMMTISIWYQIFIEKEHSFLPAISPRVEVRRRRTQHGHLYITSGQER